MALGLIAYTAGRHRCSLYEIRHKISLNSACKQSMDSQLSMRRKLTISICLALTFLISSCAYMQSASKQTEYSRIQETDPSQRNLKHMINRQTFFVYGRILDEAESYSGHSIAVLAYIRNPISKYCSRVVTMLIWMKVIATEKCTSYRKEGSS